MKERKLFSLCISFLLIVFLFLLFFEEKYLENVNAYKLIENITPGDQVTVAGQIYKREEKSDYQILYLKNISITYHKQSFKQSRIIVYLKNTQSLKIGHKIICQGEMNFFDTARNPGNFDRKAYYQKQKIYASVWGDSIEVQGEEYYFVREFLNRKKNEWAEHLITETKKNYGGIICAMLLGDKNEIDTEIKELYQVNGIAHVLAISGLHLSFVGHSIYQFIRKSSGSYLVGGTLGLLAMCMYILLIGLSVSALRAVVMFVLRVVADMTGRVYDSLTALACAAVVVIIWRPLSFFDAGFQLSFSAVIGALFVYPLISDVFCKKKIKSFFVDYLMVNLSIQLTTVPVLLYHYFEIPLYAMFLNMIVVPLVSVVLLFAISNLMMYEILGGNVEILLKGCEVILEGYEKLCLGFMEMPGAVLRTGRPSVFGIVLYYLILALFFWMSSQTMKKERKIGLLFGLAASFCLLISCPFGYQRRFEVTMLDVGQGDCIFLQKEDLCCLIDGGSSSEKEIWKYRIEPFLKVKGVTKIDYVFVSHGDEDHISGIRELLQNQNKGIRVETLVLPVKEVWDNTLYELAVLGRKKGVKTVSIDQGGSIVSKQVNITCLYPDKKENVETGNEASMVLEVSYLNLDVLLTGDIENKGEEKLISLLKKKYDVLKVSHHGSRNSTMQEFLNLVQPKVGLISAGEKNPYGHPHKETLNRLGESGVDVWTTIQSGAVRITVKKEKICLEEYVEKE